MVAIKVLNLDTREDELKDVQLEINVLSQLAMTDAQNVTRYHNSYLNGSKLWIIMDYCSGGSIRTLLKAGKIEEKYSAVIMREVVVALQYIHKEGIIHRDIKAANILVTNEGRVQLCDFGVAAQLTIAQVKRTSMIGTPYWMAPEVIQEGAPYDQKADIWSLGVTLYEIATGSPPLSDQEPKRAVYMIPRSKPARLEGTQYSLALKEFVAKCLDEQPEERATAEELSKTRFVKGARSVPTFIIRDLVLRYRQWRVQNKNVRDSFLLPNSGGAQIDSDDDDDTEPQDYFWDFDDDMTPQGAQKLPMPNQFPESNGANYPGSQMGTLMAGADITSTFSTANINTVQNNGLASQVPTYRAPESKSSESHPLMELFETESQPTEQLPPLIPLSTNTSAVNLNGLTSVPDYQSPMISLDMPAQYTPVEIEIPSFDALDARPKLPQPANFAAHSLSLLPVSSASAPNLPEMAKSRLGTLPNPVVPSVVTPHTPIKPVFSQTNLNMHNNVPPPMLGTTSSTSLQHQKVTPQNTMKSSLRRTPSPKRGTKTKASPKTIGGPLNMKAVGGNRIPSHSSQRTLNSQSSIDSSSTTDVEDLQGSFDFSNDPSHSMEKPRSLRKSSSSASLDGINRPAATLQPELMPSALLTSAKQQAANSQRQNLFLAMPTPSFQGQQPAVLQPPPSFNIFNPSNHAIGTGHSSSNSQDNGQAISQQQLLYNQQLMQQQLKQGPSVLPQVLPVIAAERGPRALTSQKQFMQKQIQKQKQHKDRFQEQRQRGGSTSVLASPLSGLPTRRQPKLTPLDSNMLLECTAREEVVGHFDTLLASLITTMEALEQDLSSKYL